MKIGIVEQYGMPFEQMTFCGSPRNTYIYVPMDEYSEHADSDIIQTILAGDSAQFRVLIDRYQSRILTVLFRHTGDRVLAEDLAQEVFVRAYKGLRTFRGESQLSTWLIRIALNVLKSHFSSRRHRMALNTEEYVPGTHDQLPAESGEGESELEAVVRAAATEISSPFKEVLFLCGFDGLSYDEASQVLKVPVGTIRSRLNRARIMLRKAVGAAVVERGSGGRER
jgi:RNA polymerase sigma-70 factor (ECF subfamily)